MWFVTLVQIVLGVDPMGLGSKYLLRSVGSQEPDAREYVLLKALGRLCAEHHLPYVVVMS